ncbi:MAG: UPF0175 family protein [Hormoscilla sp. GUM202]|nr:UPF0175 family protein [Hormoscilla sp. GUM202]
MSQEKKRQITIEIPENVACYIEEEWGDLEQRTLEALAVEGYRAGILTAGQVRWMLNLSCRYEVDKFLKEREVYLHYNEAELEHDIQVLNKLMP